MEERKCDVVLREICGATYDRSKVLETKTTYFTAAIGSTKHKYYKQIKHTYKGKETKVLKASSKGSFDEFIAPLKHDERTTTEASA